jgi:hypothetical protein
MSVLRAFAASIVFCLVWSGSAVAATSSPVRFTVKFADGARLGHDTPLILDLQIGGSLDPVTDLRLLTPAGLTLANSRLGAAECRRPQSEFTRVMSPVLHERCPANSLLGTGTAIAGLVFSEEQTLFGTAVIELHAAPPVKGKPGLLVTADTYDAVRLQLTYGGYFYVPPPAFGLGLAIMVPAVPNPPFGAPLAVSRLRLTVGGSSIRYHRLVHGRQRSYRPGGIPLPDTCPSGGFRFRAILRFADATRRSIDAVTPCPARRGV